jgi:hypothetical protein
MDDWKRAELMIECEEMTAIINHLSLPFIQTSTHPCYKFFRVNFAPDYENGPVFFLASSKALQIFFILTTCLLFFA